MTVYFRSQFVELNMHSDKTHYLFLNSGLPEKMSGIESAVLKRYQLFERRFGIRPTYVTFKYDLNYPRVIEQFKALGKISKKFQHVNLYSYYQSYGKRVRKQNQQVSEQSNQVFYCQGKKTHSSYYDERGRISHTNYYDHHGSRTMLDNFDRNGYRFRSVVFNPENKLRILETFYRIDGSICYTKQFKHLDDKAVISTIWVYDDNGMVKMSFDSEEKFHTYLLEFYLCTAFKQGEVVNLIGDRGRELIYELDKTQISATLRLFYMLHSFHLKKSMDMNSKLKNAYFFLENLTTSQIDRVIVLSPQQKSDIAQRFGSPEKLAFIPHTVNFFPKTVQFSARDPYKVMAAGRLSSEKCFEVIIQDFVKVVDKVPQARLEIFGQGSLKVSLQALIDELKLSNNVFLRDYTNDIYGEFSTARCTLINSDHEGQPLVMLESLSSGCPVVSTDFRYGPALMIESGKNGFIVEKGNSQAFADKIIEILTNSQLAESLSKNAYGSVQRFTEETVAPLWNELMGIPK